MCELRDPAYPRVSTTFPGIWRSTLRLYCWTRPSLKSRFCEEMFPPKVAGSVGCERRGNPFDMVRPVPKGIAIPLLAQADGCPDGANGEGQRSGKKDANADSAKKGGFSHSPCPP